MVAIVRRCVNNALQGDPKYFAAFLQLVRPTGLLDEEPEPSSTQSISAEDEAILATFIERLQGMSNTLDGEGPSTEAEVVGTVPEAEPEEKA
ncbi:hypothetical protein AUC69_07915 [Methyloceanibacter superfactus]|uniref:Uncharacterized protein n=2 Tax=Methyloceanibacter superfactus TaxID=1774969 RepID=A0A1E3W2M9_9HYPH|nr:hypothetical protein AUC69_07915 [Methyloceanibacter superfactus]